MFFVPSIEGGWEILFRVDTKRLDRLAFTKNAGKDFPCFFVDSKGRFLNATYVGSASTAHIEIPFKLKC